MIKSNFQYVQELGKIIDEDSKLRHELIFLETLAGSYQARKEHPERFVPQKQFTSEIFEAEQIAMMRKDNREAFRPIRENHKILSYKKKGALKNRKIGKEGIYGSLLYFAIDSDLELQAGEILEKKLIKGKFEIIKGMSDRDISLLFKEEYNLMFDALKELKGELSRDKNKLLNIPEY